MKKETQRFYWIERNEETIAMSSFIFLMLNSEATNAFGIRHKRQHCR